MEAIYKQLCLYGAIAAVLFGNELFTLIVLVVSAPIWMLWILEKATKGDKRYGQDNHGSGMF